MARRSTRGSISQRAKGRGKSGFALETASGSGRRFVARRPTPNGV
jgi:hypothetical protein